MNKLDLTPLKVLGLIGALIWSFTILIRGSSLMTIDVVRIMTYTAPNLGASFVVFYLTTTIYMHVFKKAISKTMSFIILCGIFALALASEIYHAAFLSSPFDLNDIYMTLVGLLITYLVYNWQYRKSKES